MASPSRSSSASIASPSRSSSIASPSRSWSIASPSRSSSSPTGTAWSEAGAEAGVAVAVDETKVDLKPPADAFLNRLEFRDCSLCAVVSDDFWFEVSLVWAGAGRAAAPSKTDRSLSVTSERKTILSHRVELVSRSIQAIQPEPVNLPVLPDFDYERHLTLENLPTQLAGMSDKTPMHVCHVLHDVRQSLLERISVPPDI